LVEFKAAFDRFDVNGDKTLSLSEFKDAVKLLGMELSDAEIKQIV
jgi:Ca2+-binding EF-hand superfamily protein